MTENVDVMSKTVSVGFVCFSWPILIGLAVNMMVFVCQCNVVCIAIWMAHCVDTLDIGDLMDANGLSYRKSELKIFIDLMSSSI